MRRTRTPSILVELRPPARRALPRVGDPDTICAAFLILAVGAITILVYLALAGVV